MTKDKKNGIIVMLLAVTEDRATLRSDLSAGYVVGRKSDAMDGAFFFSLYERYHSSWKPQCVKLMPNEVGRSRAKPDEPKAPDASDFRHSPPFAHGFLASDYDWIRVVYNAVADGICQNGIANLVPPARNVEPRAKNGGSLSVSPFGNLQQIPRLGFLQRIQ